ncbi:hypothetical protein QTP88_001026 [Uroleucon formosanum]
MNDKIRTLLIEHGPEQGKNPDFSYSENVEQRKFDVTKSIYCFFCMLFPSQKISKAFITDPKTGFNDWRKLSPRITDHENTFDHKSNVFTWNSFEKRLREGKTIDKELQKDILNEKERWTQILKIILDCGCFCCVNNLALREELLIYLTKFKMSSFAYLSEDEYSSTSYIPSDLNESSSDDASISETQNDNTQIVVNDDASDIADNDQSNEDINSNKGRKRIRDETKWKRNIRKNLRNSGKRYITSKGKEFPEKYFEDFECMCHNKCHQLFSLEHRETVFKSYYALGCHNLQTSFLCSLITVLKKNRTYNKNTPSRKKFFKRSFKISDGRITRALIHKVGGNTPPKDARGKSAAVNKVSNERRVEVIHFIKKFPTSTSHYSRHKNLNKNYLRSNLNISIMYNLYKQEHNDPVSMYVFRQIFDQDFNLSFHPPVFDSCKKCDIFITKIKTASEEDKVKLNEEHELHLRKAEAARNGMDSDVQAAKTDNQTTVIAFDLMKTLATPSLSVGVAYYKRQLWTYNLGIHNLSTNDAYMYVWDESIASRGPQEIGSCILHFVKNYVNTEKLIMYSDQCGGQNRNIKMALICNFIVCSDHLSPTQIHHKFLVSGHSYLPCDRDFGVIEKQKKYHPEIYIPNDWITVILKARKRNPFKVVQMTQEDFFSTVLLEKDITNRKLNGEGEKVEWLKFQWILFSNDKPYQMFYKYSNNEFVTFSCVNLSKRVMAKPKELQKLYPNGHPIQKEKYNDLIELMQFIPPIHHDFYKNIKQKK